MPDYVIVPDEYGRPGRYDVYEKPGGGGGGDGCGCILKPFLILLVLWAFWVMFYKNFINASIGWKIGIFGLLGIIALLLVSLICLFISSLITDTRKDKVAAKREQLKSQKKKDNYVEYKYESLCKKSENIDRALSILLKALKITAILFVILFIVIAFYVDGENLA